MAQPPRVSAIIPTYNRRELVQRAIDSALAQTLPLHEIVVVDDGSTDGTGDALKARYGERITYVWQSNAGVSAARNAGMAMARGELFALLDSDDLWAPEKTERQCAYLDANPQIGMVVCDVARVDADGQPFDFFRRRDVIASDGWVLGDLLMNPALIPASAMLRREVFADVGGFDPALRTAEDIDFFLRVARRWQVGVSEGAMVRAMRGHEGLSAESSTYDDYVRVMERVVAACEGTVPEDVRRRALSAAYVRNARGLMLRGRWRDACTLAARAWRAAPDAAARRDTAGLAGFALRRLAVRTLRR
jgi:glycosyltransferase involved in cell wall biosynthesis